MFKVTAAAAGLYVLVQTLSVIAEPHVWMRSSLKAMNTLGQIKKKISHSDGLPKSFLVVSTNTIFIMNFFISKLNLK